LNFALLRHRQFSRLATVGTTANAVIPTLDHSRG